MPEIASFQFYTRLLIEINDALEAYISDTASNVIAAITPVATTLLIIYVMLWGWSMMRGVISEPITDGVSRIVRLSLITGLALNLGAYNAYLADMLWNSPEALGRIITGTTSDSSISFLDTLMSQMYNFGLAFYNKSFAGSVSGLPSFGLFFIALGIWLLGVVTTAMAAFLLVLSKMALAILIAIGPIFILLVIFEPTKRFFDVWLGQALNYVFMAMLTSAAIKLILGVLETYLTNAGPGSSADPGLNQAMPAFGYAIVGFLVLLQMPSIASALGGGVAISTLGAVGWTYQKVTGGVGSSLSAVRPTNARRSINKLRSDGRIIKETAVGVANLPGAMYRRVTGGRTNRVSKRP